MTHITLKFTGHVWDRMRVYQMNCSFEGNILSDLLRTLIVQFNLRDLVMDGNNNIIPWTSIIVNGRSYQFLGDLETPIRNGDEVIIMRLGVAAF